jgi:signal peptidase I
VTDPIEVADPVDRELEFVNEATERDVKDPDIDVVPGCDVVEFALTELEEPVDNRVVNKLVPSAIPERADNIKFPPGTLNELKLLAERRILRATLRRFSR